MKWNVLNEGGNMRTLEITALHVSACKVRQLNPHFVIDKCSDETISMKDYGIKLSSSSHNEFCGINTIIISKNNNLPWCEVYSDKDVHVAFIALIFLIFLVLSSSTQAEKYILQWC